MSDPNDQLQKWFDDWSQKLAVSLGSALTKTEAKDLTEDEKFALAVNAGVSWDSKYEDGKIVTTSAPCGFAHDGQQWNVYVRAING